MLVAGAAGLAGLLIGWLAASATSKVRPQVQDVAKFMEQVVTLEELEAHRRANQIRLAQSGRRTDRFDGGPTAKVMRMRKRKSRRQIRRA